MTKRQRFILTALLSALCFIGIQFLPADYKFMSIGGLSVFSTALLAWSLREGLGLNTTLLTLVLPAGFTVGVGLFWFLLPATFLTQLPFVILYGIGMYALALTANVYTVSTIRTIALLRAAKGVGFVLTLVTFFLIFDAILSLKLPIFWSVPLISIASFPMFLQAFWIVDLDTKISLKELQTTLVATLVVTQVAAMIFFWPVSVIVGSIYLTAPVYVLVGLGQADLEDRLFKQTAREYLIFGVLVYIVMFFFTRWGGGV